MSHERPVLSTDKPAVFTKSVGFLMHYLLSKNWLGLLSALGASISSASPITMTPQGYTGLGITPTAQLLQWGSMSVDYDNQLPGAPVNNRFGGTAGHNYVVGFGLLPFFELAGRLAANSNNANCFTEGCGVRDLSGSFKIGTSLDREDRLRVAIGATDLGGNVTYFRAYYGVASYELDQWLLSAGVARRTGAGIRGSQAPLHGPFASVAYQPTTWLRGHAEHTDGNTWAGAKLLTPASWLPEGWQAHLGVNLRLNDNRFTERAWWNVGLTIPLTHLPSLGPSVPKTRSYAELGDAQRHATKSTWVSDVSTSVPASSAAVSHESTQETSAQASALPQRQLTDWDRPSRSAPQLTSASAAAQKQGTVAPKTAEELAEDEVFERSIAHLSPQIQAVHRAYGPLATKRAERNKPLPITDTRPEAIAHLSPQVQALIRSQTRQSSIQPTTGHTSLAEQVTVTKTEPLALPLSDKATQQALSAERTITPAFTNVAEPIDAPSLISTASTTPSEPVGASALVSLAEALRARGFEDIDVGHIGRTVAIRINNATYNWNSVDALGVALATVAKGLASYAVPYKLVLTQRQLPIVGVDGRTDCLQQWIAHGSGGCTLGRLFTPGYIELDSLHAGTQWVVSGFAPSWRTPRISLNPILRNGVGTDYGTFDYSLGVQLGLQQPLWTGAVFDIRQNVPLDESSDYEPGRVYGGDRIRNRLSRAIIVQTLRVPVERWIPGIEADEAARTGLASLTAQASVGQMGEYYKGAVGEASFAGNRKTELIDSAFRAAGCAATRRAAQQGPHPVWSVRRNPCWPATATTMLRRQPISRPKQGAS